MNVRTYAIVITLALLAALTNPTQEHHYAKLRPEYPWLDASLLASAQLLFASADSADASREATGESLLSEWSGTPALAYIDYRLASAVFSCLRWAPCATGGEKCSLLSFGFFGFVFVRSQNDVVPPSEATEPAPKDEAAPPRYVVETESAVKPPAADGAPQFFAAYRDFRKAETMLREGRKKEAKKMFINVLEQLEQIKAQAPGWQPMVVDFRLKRTRDHLHSLSNVEP